MFFKRYCSHSANIYIYTLCLGQQTSEQWECLNFRIDGPCRADHVMKFPFMHATNDPCLRFPGTERWAGPWSALGRKATTTRILSFSTSFCLYLFFFALDTLRPTVLRIYIFVEGCRRALLAALPLRAMLASNTIAILLQSLAFTFTTFVVCIFLLDKA